MRQTEKDRNSKSSVDGGRRRRAETAKPASAAKELYYRPKHLHITPQVSLFITSTSPAYVVHCLQSNGELVYIFTTYRRAVVYEEHALARSRDPISSTQSDMHIIATWNIIAAVYKNQH